MWRPASLKLAGEIAGLDPKAANEVFLELLSDENLNQDRVCEPHRQAHHPERQPGQKVLNEHPFNNAGNVIKPFDQKIDMAKKIIHVIDRLNERLSV